MQTAVFYGSSDDLIEVEGVKGGDEFNAWKREEGVFNAKFNLGGKLRVYANYGADAAVWAFAVAQVDENIPLPDWPIRIVQSIETPYSVQLVVDCPDDVMVFRERD